MFDTDKMETVYAMSFMVRNKLFYYYYYYYISLALYPRRGSRGILDIPSRRLRFTKITQL
jgi:hypothetical protein